MQSTYHEKEVSYFTNALLRGISFDNKPLFSIISPTTKILFDSGS